MVEDVTQAAVAALQALSTSLGIPAGQAYYKIENQHRGPVSSMWIITPDTKVDETKYYTKTINGVNLAIHIPDAEFLTRAVIDYRPGISEAKHLYDNIPLGTHRPVWPKGFVFHHQSFQVDIAESE